jgi:hypothetical protein
LKPAELVENSAGRPTQGTDKDRELISSLAGGDAVRDRVVAQKTSQVVLTSLGVLKGQKEGRKRSSSLALAAILLVLLVLGPFIWRVADDLVGGEFLGDTATQASLLVCIVCAALLAAALIAGWRRR